MELFGILFIAITPIYLLNKTVVILTMQDYQIVEWLKKEYNLEVTYATVYARVHYRLQAKLKVPRPQSALQDVKAVELFKKTSSRQS